MSQAPSKTYLVIPQLKDDRAEYYGPFTNNDEAVTWAEETFGDSWMIVPVRSKESVDFFL